MARWDEYRRFSEDCLELARGAEDEQRRRLFLHMAQVWLEFAEQYKRQDAKTPAKS